MGGGSENSFICLIKVFLILSEQIKLCNYTIQNNLQSVCSFPILNSMICPEELKDVKDLVKEGQKKALCLLNKKIDDTERLDPAIKYAALVFRADLKLKLHCEAIPGLSDAKNDLETAILLMPNIVEAYWKLSEVEQMNGQFGKAEVALLLGLKIAPDNENLKAKLTIVREADNILLGLSLDDSLQENAIKEKRILSEIELASLIPGSPDLVKAIFNASFETLEKLWKPQLKEYTFGEIKSPLIHLVIHGANHHSKLSNGLSDEMLLGFECIINFLFDQGCRLDARDQIGFTAVSYSVRLEQKDLLDSLLMKGADPNLQSVFGCHPLFNAVKIQNFEAASSLLHFGADPLLPNNDGVTPLGIAIQNREMLPEMVSVIEHYIKPVKVEDTCYCGSGISQFGCMRCKAVFYCSNDCEAKDMAEHKIICDIFVASHKRLAIEAFDGQGNLPATIHAQNLVKDQVEICDNIIVKVQVPLLGVLFGFSSLGQFLIYNEDKSFYCFGNTLALDGREIRRIIREKGNEGGLKAYFKAFVEPGKKELVLITNPILPAQPW